MVEQDDVTRIKSEIILCTCHRSHTLGQMMLPCPTTSPESSTNDSGMSTEQGIPDVGTSETTETSVENSGTENTKTYPSRSRNPVQRYEPTW